MKIVIVLFLVDVLAGIGIVMAIMADRCWYKRHPGAEERFAQIDEEVTLQGR